MRILAIEDNPRLSERLQKLLQKTYVVELASSGHEGIVYASSRDYDCIILDLGLPDMSGAEVCTRIREFYPEAPILVLTGVDTLASKVELLDIGADDYLVKPFEADELLARLRALSRRQPRQQDLRVITIADLSIYPESRRVTRSGKEITLRKKEFDILEYLARNVGRILTRDMIINHAWANGDATWAGSVDVHIKQLRDRVDRPFTEKLIRTSYGVGYSMEVPKSALENKADD